LGTKVGHRHPFRDYIALALSLLAAMLVWLIHNLSLDYSDIAQCTILAECNIDGYSEIADTPNEIAARCDMPGFSMIYFKRTAHVPTRILFAKEDMHYKSNEIFYMTSSDLNKYFHEIFGEQAHLEYFVTDTVYFRFTKVNYKKVPVIPVTDISFKAQFMSKGDIAIIPDSVLVYGTDDQLATVSKISTKQITLHNVSSEEYGETELEIPSGLRLSNKDVEYSLQAVRYTEHSVTLPVRMYGAPTGYDVHIIPSTAQVRVRTIFPSETSFEKAYVGISFDDFSSSISGKCTGDVKGLESEVLYCDITPEVFECLIQ